MKLILLFIISLGIILRLVNISPFKFYPDAYQNLIVAENLTKYQSVVGFLGDGGMLFPHFIAWSRFGYPMLINLASLFTLDRTLAAQLINLLASILSIPLAYLLIKTIFKSKITGLFGSLLISISFNHIVWSGFIMTEAVGVFISLLILYLLFLKIEKVSLLGSIYDLVLGAVLAFGFITRFEYLVWILPITFLIFKQNPTPLVKLVNIAVSFIFVLAIFLSFYFPLNSLFQSSILAQIQRNLIQLAVFSIFMIGVIYFSNLVTRLPARQGKYQKNIIVLSNLLAWARRVKINLITASLGIFVLMLILDWPVNLTGMRNFFASDPILGVFALLGITLMLRGNMFNLGVFTLFNWGLLSIVYYQINPLMQRYNTHLLPLLLIPASYGVVSLLFRHNRHSGLAAKGPLRQRSEASEPRSQGEQDPESPLEMLNRVQHDGRKTRNDKGFKMGMTMIRLVFVGLLVYQINLSFNGMRYWDSGTWFRENYEEKASKIILEKINQKDLILLVSFPESYYYHTHLTTHSLTDHYPFIYIDESLNNKSLLIVSDMGMRDIFPNFSSFLDKNLTQYRTSQFFINEVYHYEDRIEKETSPVILYSISVSQLKDKLKSF